MADPPKTVLSVRMTDDLREDLEVVLRTGVSVAHATRAAFHLAARICTVAWENGGYPEGVMPWVCDVRYEPYDAGDARRHPTVPS